jgi:hypothetical protein
VQTRLLQNGYHMLWTNSHWHSGMARGFLPQGIVDSFPTQWTRLSTEPVCVGSRLHKPVVYTKAWWTP